VKVSQNTGNFKHKREKAGEAGAPSIGSVAALKKDQTGPPKVTKGKRDELAQEASDTSGSNGLNTLLGLSLKFRQKTGFCIELHTKRSKQVRWNAASILLNQCCSASLYVQQRRSQDHLDRDRHPIQ
jgi:hypothetical protein